MTETPDLELDGEGRAWWVWSDRRRVPVAAGGDDGGEGGDAGDGGEGGDAGEGDDAKGKGGAAGDGKGDGEAGESEADRKLRNENKALRARAKAAEEERDRLKAATQTDAERAEEARKKDAAERDAAVAELRTTRLELAVAKAAKPLGITDTTAAAALMDAEAVEWGDDNRPDQKSVTRALAAAAKAHPILVRQGGADGGDRGSGTETVGGFSETLRQAAGKGR